MRWVSIHERSSYMAFQQTRMTREELGAIRPQFHISERVTKCPGVLTHLERPI